MALRYCHIVLVLLLLVTTQSTKCAPTLEEETVVAKDPCDTEDLQNCLIGDTKCENLNAQLREKEQAICIEHPQCSFCHGSIPVESVDGNFVVLPEIIPTLSPPLNSNSGIPINDTIIIDADVSTITERQPLITNEKDPIKLIERNIVIENDNETHYYRGYVDPSSNITTIIRLTNLINNTNIVNMPTTLNNTNVNNIHVYSNRSSSNGGKFNLGYTDDGPCCWSMKLGDCKQTTVGPKCSHKKQKVCGKQCNKKMIHPRSMCSSIPQWPYVLCPQSQNPPFMPYPYYPPYNPMYPQYNDDNDDDDDDAFPMFPDEEELDKDDSTWFVSQEKCKIVSEDGLQITNCTDINVEFEHPYARNSVDDQLKRNTRHTEKYPQNVQQQIPYMQPYGYPMMQPMFLQPIPIYYYVPQYFPPPSAGMMNNYPQQLPFPPLESDQYYEEPVKQSKAHNPYKKSKKHPKKHPIIVEHDDEL